MRNNTQAPAAGRRGGPWVRATVLIGALALTAAAAPPIHVLLIDGEQAGAYHAWQETTPYLKRMLEDRSSRWT